MSSRKENTRSCCVCGSQPIKDPSITLHRFPRPGYKNGLRCELWAKYCFPNEHWSSPEFQNELFTKHKVLCRKHFLPSCFVEKKLFRTAVPDDGSDRVSSVSDQGFAKPPTIFLPECRPFNLVPVVDQFDDVPVAGPFHVTPVPGSLKILNPLEHDARLKTHMEKSAPYEVAGQLDDVPFTGPFHVTPVPGSLRILEPLEHDARLKTHKDTAPYEIDDKTKVLLRKMLNKMNKVYRFTKTIKHMKNELYLNVLSNNELVKQILKQKLTSTFSLLLQSKLQKFKRKTTGRRWNLESKKVALSLYKRSPTSYKLLRRIICLPAPSSLQSLLSKFEMEIGTNLKVLSALKNTIKNLASPSKRQLILMWDEMPIKKNMSYNPKEDIIDGYQDHATQGRIPVHASYALLFMVVGIRAQIKQPIAYYLSSESVTADRLAVLIKEVIISCFDFGLEICASVCDIDGANKKALHILGASIDNPCIGINNNKITTLFDTPHLLKYFRNQFLKYDIKLLSNITSDNEQGIGIAKWDYIKQFYELDNANPNFTYAPCLTKEHLDPKSKQKSKVKFAAQVLSHSVAGGMFKKVCDGIAKWDYIKQFYELDNANPNFTYAPCLTKEHLDPKSKQKSKVKFAAQVLSHSVAGGMFKKVCDGDMPTEVLSTANLVSCMDELFDAVNAHTPYLRRGKKCSTNLRKDSKHLEHFNKMKSILNNLEFLGCHTNPSSKDGWIWTINGIEMIWKHLTTKYKGVESLATRRLQLDPLEKLFDCIRTNCGAKNPTVSQFVVGLKTAIMSNLAYTGSGNCEMDNNQPIIKNSKKLLTQTYMRVNRDTEHARFVYIDDEITSSLEKNFDKERSEQVCAYVCGYIIKNTSKCRMCRNIFVSETLEEVHSFIDYKNYDSLKYSLIYASKTFVNCVKECASIVNSFLEQVAHVRNIKIRVVGLLNIYINFDFLQSCAQHKDINKDYIINSVFHICIN